MMHETWGKCRSNAAHCWTCRCLGRPQRLPEQWTIYIQAQTHIHTNTCTQTCTHIHTCAHTHTHTHMYIHVCTHTHKHMYTDVHTHTRVYTHTHTHTHISLSVRAVSTGFCTSRTTIQCSADRGHLDFPHVRCATYGKWSFAYAFPSAWNSLPGDLRDTYLSLSVFHLN